MRFSVVGSGGQLGTCLTRTLEADPRHQLVAAFGHAELDVADASALAGLFSADTSELPDVLVNAAAFTAVDRCESESDLANRVNGVAPGLLADACRRAGVRLAHVSTDYVFDGRAREPYREDAPIAPRTAYGRSKAEGERRVLEVLPGALIVRTSWVFGPGWNFVEAILRQARLRRAGEAEGPLRVVDDQRGCPTYAADLARGIIDLADLRWGAESADERGMGEGARGLENGSAADGVFHLSNAGAITWWTFARAILDLAGCEDLEIDRISTSELDLPAERPLYSVLDCGKAARLGVELRPWRDALAAYLKTLPEATLAVRPREEAARTVPAGDRA